MVNRYPNTLINELNSLLAPYGQMIDGSVSDRVTDGIAADVSPFTITRDGPIMHGAFGMLLHMGPRIRAEIETSHSGGKDFSIALSGDPKADAKLILVKVRKLLNLGQSLPTSARRNPGSFKQAVARVHAAAQMLMKNESLPADKFYVACEDLIKNYTNELYQAKVTIVRGGGHYSLLHDMSQFLALALLGKKLGLEHMQHDNTDILLGVVDEHLPRM